MFKKILYPTAFEKYFKDVLGCVTNLQAADGQKCGGHVAENMKHFKKQLHILKHFCRSIRQRFGSTTAR